MADMMAKDPKQRIPSARDVIQRSAPFVTGQAEMPELTPEVRPEGPQHAVPPIALPTLKNSALGVLRDTTATVCDLW